MLRYSRVAALLYCLVLACSEYPVAQTQPGTGSRGTPPATYAIGVVNSTQPKLASVVTGSVITQDRQPVSDATVLLICDGLVRGTSTVRSKGEFSLTIQRTLDGVHAVPVNDCEVYAVVSGVRSEPRQVMSLRGSEALDVGQLIVNPSASAVGTTVSANSLRAPAEARKLLHKGVSEAASQKWEEAQKHLERATQIYPKYSEAWHELGLVLQHQARTAEARNAFQQALAADPVFVRPYFGLVGLAADGQDWREMQRVSESANALFTDPLMLFYNAIANFNLHDFDAAEKSLLHAAKVDRDHHLPQVELLLGDVLIQRRDFSGAAAKVREYLQLSPNGPQADAARSELARLEQLSSR